MNYLASPTIGGLYPAASKALGYKIVNSDVAYYGGQNIYKTFAKSSALVDTSWQYGPTYEQTQTVFQDGFAAVKTGDKTLAQVSNEAQAQTLSDMKRRGISASSK